MSNFIKEVNWKKYYCIDNYFWSNIYWYIEFEEWDTWLNLDVSKRKVLREIEKKEEEITTKKWYVKQLKNAYNILVESNKIVNKENRNLRKELDTEKQENKSLAQDYKKLNDLDKVWTKELMFSNLQKEHYKSLLEEVEVLVNKWIKKELIQKVISNWYKRAELDLAIHCDEIFFNNK